MFKNTLYIYILIFTVLLIFVYYLYPSDLPKWFIFDTKDSLDEWQEKVFKNKVLYVVKSGREGGYLLAKSIEACSGLFYKLRFDPKEFPMISWEWKVVSFPEKEKTGLAGANEREGWIEKDDYAARVYVIFPSLDFKKTKSIEYVWDEDLPEESVITSPYFKNIKLMVAESGRQNIDKWVFEKRNICEDYKKAFGREPFSKVGAIAIMTDTDNTLSTAEAFYKDIKVGYKDE